MKRFLKPSLLAIFMVCATTAAHAATLIGNSIEAYYYFPTIGTEYGGASVAPNPFVVGSGVDTVINVEGVTFLNIDFSANTLVITLNTILSNPTWNNALQNGPAFKVLSGNAFSPVSSVVTSNSGPVSAFLSGGDLIINWAGMSYSSGDTVTVSFEPSAVPLPASVGFLTLGLAGLAWAGRRRRPVV
ncbi:MAG: VPLPA-CTERM sorting domain-containing protein [Paracoccaceae bacterium]